MDRLKLVLEMTLLSRGLAVDDEAILLAHRAPDYTLAFHARHQTQPFVLCAIVLSWPLILETTIHVYAVRQMRL